MYSRIGCDIRILLPSMWFPCNGPRSDVVQWPQCQCHGELPLQEELSMLSGGYSYSYWNCGYCRDYCCIHVLPVNITVISQYPVLGFHSSIGGGLCGGPQPKNVCILTPGLKTLVFLSQPEKCLYFYSQPQKRQMLTQKNSARKTIAQ